MLPNTVMCSLLISQRKENSNCLEDGNRAVCGHQAAWCTFLSSENETQINTRLGSQAKKAFFLAVPQLKQFSVTCIVFSRL